LIVFQTFKKYLTGWFNPAVKSTTKNNALSSHFQKKWKYYPLKKVCDLFRKAFQPGSI